MTVILVGVRRIFVIQVHILNIIGENTFSATLKVHLEKMLKCRPGLTSPYDSGQRSSPPPATPSRGLKSHHHIVVLVAQRCDGGVSSPQFQTE